jgi:hypothetical protein
MFMDRRDNSPAMTNFGGNSRRVDALGQKRGPKGMRIVSCLGFPHPQRGESAGMASVGFVMQFDRAVL